MTAILRRSAPGAILGEGPLWSKRDHCVYWVDILSHNLHAYFLNGESKTWHFPEPIGWVIERAQGGFIAGLMSGFAEVTLDPLTIRHIATPYPHEPENRLNTDLSWQEVDGPYKIANGPTFSADHARVYHTDTGKNEVYVFDVIDGELANKTLWLTFPEDWGGPDGMTTDAQGGIWIAHWGPGKVTRFNPDATVDFSIDLPAKQITSLCFAGDNLDRVFVTSAAENLPEDREGGTLFEIPAPLLRGHTGLEPQKFKG
jgi:sugar lactone lactonase YvrE